MASWNVLTQQSSQIPDHYLSIDLPTIWDKYLTSSPQAPIFILRNRYQRAVVETFDFNTIGSSLHSLGTHDLSLLLKVQIDLSLHLTHSSYICQTTPQKGS